MKKWLVSLLAAVLTIALVIPFTVLADGSHTVNGDIDLTSGSVSGKTLENDGYEWSSATNTFTMQDLTVTGNIVLPNIECTVVVKGACSATYIRRDDTGAAQGVTVKGEDGATLSSGIEVPGNLILKDLKMIDGSIRNGSVNFSHALKLENSEISVTSLSCAGDDGIKLTDSKLTVDPGENGFGQFWTMTIAMDEKSEIRSEIYMSNYGKYDTSAVEAIKDYVAEPDGGYFAKKSPYPNAADEYLTIVDKDGEIASHFVLRAPKVKYNVSLDADPAAAGSVTGAGTYDDGTSVTVKASANDGYHFVSWNENGTSVSKEANYTFTIGSNRTLTAVFEKDTPTPPSNQNNDQTPENTPSTSKSNESGKITPAATSDPSQIGLFGALAVFSVAGAIGAVYKNKHYVV